MSHADPAPLTDAELLDAALTAARTDGTDQSDVRWSFVRALHRRPEKTIFERAASWCTNPDVVERTLGADVLAQLGSAPGGGSRPFAAESAAILSGLLRDREERVIMSALYALGHLSAGDPSGIAPLSKHPSSGVRHAVAYALGGRADELSIRVLIDLSNDVDKEVRDWATFGLGSLSEVDTPELREALISRLSDEDAEVRGEALIGLAKRGDRRAISPVITALKSGTVDSLTLEAAEELIRAYPRDHELREAFATRRSAE